MMPTVRFLVRTMTILAATHALSQTVQAQNESSPPERNDYRAPRFLLAPLKSGAPPTVLDVGRTPILSRRIAVDLDGSTLGEAISTISAKIGLRIGYAEDAVSTDRRVHLRAQSITVAAALTDVLAGAGVDVVFTNNGSVALVKRPRAPSGVLTGGVTDSATRRPLQGVQIQIEGTGLGAVTDVSGHYRISGVPAGAFTVTARRLGYSASRRRINIASDADASADFVLTAIATTLEDVVTTVTGTQRRLEVGNVVGSIDADSIVREAPVTNLTSLINARVPGTQVIMDNGLTGSSPRVRIRGLNSFTVSNQPLLVVDGIRVENSTATLGTGYGQTTGRFNDLNPEEIESIEIVKGPSAATLYGTDAANGVIVVRTKRGRSGHNTIQLYAETGLVQEVGPFPDNYYSWGHNSTTGAVQQCVLTQVAAGVCKADSVTVFNPLTNSETRPFSDGSRRQFGVQSSGGSDRFTYFLSGEYEDEDGVLRMPAIDQARVSAERGGVAIPENQIRPNTLSRISLRSNAAAHLGSKADVSVQLGVVLSDVNVVGDGIISSGNFGPGFRSLQDGWLSFLSRPGEAFSLRNRETATHFINSIGTNWRPLSWLATRATVGLDFSSALQDGLQRRGEGPLGNDRVGKRQNLRSDVSQYTADLGASGTFGSQRGIVSRTSVGGQYNRRYLRVTTATGSGLPPGSESVTGAAVISGSEQNIETVVAGGYVEEMVGFHDRLFLTAALRADGGSAFGQNFSTAIYPKSSLSWLAVDNRPGFFNSARLRAAFGASGVQPASTASLPRLILGAAVVDGTTLSGARLDAVGNPDLKPERQTEYEAGADLEMADGRIRLEGTYYYRLSRDALINRPLAGEFGISSRQENIGSVSNKGIEALLSLTPFNSPALTWNASLNGSINRNKLEKIGAGILFVGTNPASRNVEGRPLFSSFARPILGFADKNGNGIIEENEIQVGDTVVYVGPSLPPYQLTAATSLSLFRGRLRVATQFDYRGGHKLTNFSEINRCSAFLGNCAEINLASTSLANQAAAVANRSDAFGRTRYGFTVDGSFTRWRELSITYQLPSSVLRAFKSTDASITLTGRNLHLFTKYPGLDPETNDAVGLPNTEGYGGNPTSPPVRYWLVRINLGLGKP
jgi:TonB-linked SusC/RagA family outer membrane protein